jgi:glycosyltransferase involved in cell wall biosynthesis
MVGETKPRRVAHVLRKYDPSEWGGTETHVCEITRRLSEHGFEPEVHAPSGPDGAGALGPNVRLIRYHSFLPFVGLPHRRRALIANAGNIASLDEPVRLVRDRGIDLAHLHTMGRIGGAVRTAMRLTGRPYVVSVHGPFLANREWLEADTRARTSRVLDLGKPLGLLLGARRVVDDAARVIAFNEEERRAIAERIGDRAVRMDHGVDEARLASGNAARARGRWPELGDAPVVAVVGRLSGQKNQVLALRAFAAGAPRGHRLVLAGATTDHGYRERITREAARLGIAARVHVLGNLDPWTEIPDLYALAQLSIVTSSHEAFGLIVLEGWASGTPVLFPRHSGLTDIADALGHDRAVLDTLESEEWAAALAHMLASPRDMRANVEAGRALVRARYTWTTVTQSLAALYEEVLEENRRSSSTKAPHPSRPLEAPESLR